MEDGVDHSLFWMRRELHLCVILRREFERLLNEIRWPVDQHVINCEFSIPY